MAFPRLGLVLEDKPFLNVHVQCTIGDNYMPSSPLESMSPCHCYVNSELLKELIILYYDLKLFLHHMLHQVFQWDIQGCGTCNARFVNSTKNKKKESESESE